MDKRVILLIIALFVAAIGVFSVTEQEGVTHPFAEYYHIDAGSRPGTVEIHLIIETRSQLQLRKLIMEYSTKQMIFISLGSVDKLDFQII